MKRFLAIIILLLPITMANAQGYTQAAGIRASWVSPGVEYRYYTSDTHSLKALLALRNRGVQLHALTEFYQYDLFPFSYQLVFFYGAGLHFGFESWDEPVTQTNITRAETRRSLLAGVDGIVGVEYLFYEAPVKLGIEVKPFLDVFGRNGLDIIVHDFAFTVKYIF